MIECDIYSARLPEKTCALRYRNANGGRMRSGPGSDDPNCKVCSVGERLYREGWHKTTEPSFRDAADKRQAEEKPEKEESSMETQAEYGEKQKSAESAAAADTRTLVDPPGNHRDKNLLIDPATGKAYGRICTKCGKELEWKHFSRAAKGLCGYTAKCKQCFAGYYKGYGGGTKPEKQAKAAQSEPDLYIGQIVNGEFRLDARAKSLPEKDEMLAAIEAGAYRAVIEVVAGAFERIAENIRRANQ